MHWMPSTTTCIQTFPKGSHLCTDSRSYHSCRCSGRQSNLEALSISGRTCYSQASHNQKPSLTLRLQEIQAHSRGVKRHKGDIVQRPSDSAQLCMKLFIHFTIEANVPSRTFCGRGAHQTGRFSKQNQSTQFARGIRGENTPNGNDFSSGQKQPFGALWPSGSLPARSASLKSCILLLDIF